MIKKNWRFRVKSGSDWKLIMEELKYTNEVVNKNSTVHVLPCKIMYDGKAEVASYFNSSILRSDSHIKAELNETEGILLEYLYSLKLIKLIN